MTDERYIPKGNAYFAYRSLHDPISPDAQGWVSLRNVEAQRGRWSGSDGADFVAGLNELVEQGWAEANPAGDAFRITPQGAVLRGRLGLS